jgi:hypothetical protein
MTTPLLLPALSLARHGLRVLPLVAGAKAPLSAHGCSEATTDERTIRAWWGRWPDAGIGVVPGPRFWVLDVDAHPPRVTERKRRGRELIDGFEALRRAEAAGYVLPPTREARTPSGGRHLWWIASEPMGPTRYAALRGALAGLDVRGVDSYVVAPPTVTDAGAYAWTDRRLPVAAPAWLVKLVRNLDRAPIPPPRPLPAGAVADDGKRKWAAAVLEGCCRRIRATTTGRHAEWYAQAVLAGGIVGAGLLDGETAREALEAAAKETVQGRRHEIRRTIHDGLTAGMARPVWPEER